MTTVDLVIPCYNEQRVIAQSVRATLAWIDAHPEHGHEWRVVVADNASTDRTLEVARGLEAEHPGRVAALHIPVKGRGMALRTAWLTSEAAVVAYMDADLSTDLDHLAELVDPIARGEVALSYGTRLAAASRTSRSLRRELISRTYVRVLRLALGLHVSDAQCGFKAMSREAARALVPLVRDNRWFFDSELLFVAQRNGYEMLEVPVRWDEDDDTRVAIVRTAIDDLRGIWRLRRTGAARALRGNGGGPRDHAESEGC